MKTRLKNGDAADETFLALALESGFNSKASFNRLFRQYEKCTPVTA
jgi:AraC-like DNA-binding protein